MYKKTINNYSRRERFRKSLDPCAYLDSETHQGHYETLTVRFSSRYKC